MAVSISCVSWFTPTELCFTLPYAISEIKISNTAILPNQGKPHTNRVTASNGYAPFFRNGVTIHTATETIATLKQSSTFIT